ncbi:MAG: hypothetical protein MJZ77_05735 [Bacteroidales bacterium]|nr:hypothetical protein [Bacteroidales bacterium]
MSPDQFQQCLNRLRQQVPDFFHRFASTVISRPAEFRQAARHHLARKRRKILTGGYGRSHPPCISSRLGRSAAVYLPLLP